MGEGEPFKPTPEQKVVTEENTEQGNQMEQDANPTENIDSKHERGNSRYPTKVHDMPKHLDEYVVEKDIDDNVNYTVDYCYRVTNIPSPYNEAVNSQEASKWQEAMREEVAALIDNDTYDLVTPPEGRQIVGANGSLQ